MRADVTTITLPPEEVERLCQRVNDKLATPLTAGGRCDACDRELQEREMSIGGYATGYPLGLCGKCASFVNTKEAIDRIEREGHSAKAPAIVYNPQKAQAEEVDDA
jgi:hypothetical protein